MSDTLDASSSPRPDGAGARPGVVAVFTNGRATLAAVALDSSLVLGRGEGPGCFDDARMSRRHAEITALADGHFRVTDLGSRNGTFVDGAAVSGSRDLDGTHVVRVGDTLVVTRPNVQPFLAGVVQLDDGVIAGPILRIVNDEIASIARSSEVMCIYGETGAGKELAARRFHEQGPNGRGPFVAVNCAGIPSLLAERLLFGARKGVYSGAHTDADGYVQAANNGTLFLDEITELSLDVQAKLLRVLESRRVAALGATQETAVELGLCSAAHHDLRSAVAAGTFRDDLYFRIARPSVTVPPLRDRLEDIPWLIQAGLAAARPGLVPHVSLVEVAMSRPWAGNIRELRAEIADVARRSRDGVARADALDEDAGMPFAPPASPAAPKKDLLDQPSVETALREADGNVTEAARRLGVHRTQLRRWLAQHDIDVTRRRS